MKRIISFNGSFAVCALVCGLLAATVAQAQQRGPRGGGPGFGFPGRGPGGPGAGKAMLLRAEQVQKELGISEDQKLKLDTVLDESREKGRELFGGLRDLSEDERRAKFEELRTKGETLAQETNKKLGEILTAEQSTRLDQISLQVRGNSALLDDEVAAKLEISDEQKQKVRDLFSAQREMLQELFGGTRDLPREERQKKFEEMREKSEELRTETDKAVSEVLTDAQRTKLEELKGASFELDRRALFQGFGRRPGGDRRRNNSDSE